jgi:putative proteasome-type protease
MDSTLKSNLSVGLPLDLAVYEVDQYQSHKLLCLDENNPYFKMLHTSWGDKLREVFDGIEDPMWNAEAASHPIVSESSTTQALRKIANASQKLI